MTVEETIKLIEVLSKGYAKPDLGDCCSEQRTVYETKNYMPTIEKLVKQLTNGLK
jgi:hypothetical protein